MPTEYQIRQKPFPHTHIRASGRLKPTTYFQALKAIMQDDAFDPHFPTLLELEPGAEPAIDEVNFQEAEEAGAFISDVWGDAQRRVAITGGSADVRSFLAMAQEILNDAPMCRTFDSVAEARQWLSEADEPRATEKEKPLSGYPCSA